jgi:hypothetical protein
MELKPVRASEVGRVETRREGLSPDTHHKRSSCSPGRGGRRTKGFVRFLTILIDVAAILLPACFVTA